MGLYIYIYMYLYTFYVCIFKQYVSVNILRFAIYIYKEINRNKYLYIYIYTPMIIDLHAFILKSLRGQQIFSRSFHGPIAVWVSACSPTFRFNP